MPWIKDGCEGCEVCLDSCPVDAISMNDGQAEINNSVCTRCGDCFEACPLDMIRPNYENPNLRGRFNQSSVGRGAGRGRGGGRGTGRGVNRGNRRR